MNFKKRLFCFLLVATMLLGTMPVRVYTANGFYGANNLSVFSDMPENWSASALQNAVDNGLLNGTDGKIMPNDRLTRAQMATIIVRAFGAVTKGDLKDFSDMKAADWYADNMAKAYQMGVIKGSGGMMNPNSPITRQEVFVILARALKIQPADRMVKAFTDADEISDWAKGGVYALVNDGYIQGANGRLNPKDTITRAEFAQIMDNIVKQYVSDAGIVTEAADGNIMVNAPDVTLKDLKVKGDLYIGDGVGDGEVVLDNVTVTGRMVVRGGGANSIIIKGNSNVTNIVAARIDGVVSIKVQGNANVEIIYIKDGSDDIKIEGTVGSIEVNGQGIVVTALGASIGNINITGGNSRVMIDAHSTVQTIDIGDEAANATVEVAGGVTGIVTTAENTEITGTGHVTRVEAGSGATDTKINTPGTKIVVDIGATGVTGNGTKISEGTTVSNNTAGGGIVIPSGDESDPASVNVTNIKITNPTIVTFNCNVDGATIKWNGTLVKEGGTDRLTTVGTNTITVPQMELGVNHTLLVELINYTAFMKTNVMWIPTEEITVSGADGATTVVNGGTLQMSTTATPANVSNQTVTWSVEPGSGSATINSQTGLLTATGVGTVSVTARAADGSDVTGSLEIIVFPAAPSYTINYTLEKTQEIVPATDEYSYDGGISWVTGASTAAELTPGQNVRFRVGAAGVIPAGSVQTLVVEGRPQAAPAFSYAVGISDALLGLTANATNLEARLSGDGGISWGAWTAITANAGGKAIFAHNGGDFIQVRFKGVAGTAFASESADQYSKKTLSELSIGTKVVDNSWMWEHKTGNGYTGTGVTKPVTWVIVAKNHYGAGSGVTLLSKELIGKFIFDNRTAVHWGGVNHWGNSNHIRPWLNSSGSYAGAGFLNAFSNEFKNAVLTVNLPNTAQMGSSSYVTQDKVFIPSTTELGDDYTDTFEIGTVYPFFAGAVDADRIVKLGPSNSPYWTRSPENWLEDIVHCFLADGSHGAWLSGNPQAKENNAVRPALNLSDDALISALPNADGVYEIFYGQADLVQINSIHIKTATTVTFNSSVEGATIKWNGTLIKDGDVDRLTTAGINEITVTAMEAAVNYTLTVEKPGFATFIETDVVWTPTEGITVTEADGATTVVNGGTLQMNGAAAPANPSNQSIVWSVEPGSGSATINSQTGLLTATGVGTVSVTASAADGTGVTGSLEIIVFPAAPSYTINYTLEKTQEIVPATDEYSYDVGTSWTSGDGTELSLTPGQNVQFRVAAAAGIPAGNIKTLVVKERPPTPAYTVNFAEEKILGFAAKDTYSLDGFATPGVTPGAGTVHLTGALAPNEGGGDAKTLSIKTKATASTFQSAVQILSIPVRLSSSAVSDYTIDFVAEKTIGAVPAAEEYSTNGGITWTGGTDIPCGLTPGTDVAFRLKSTETNFVSQAKTLAVAARPSPSIPTFTHAIGIHDTLYGLPAHATNLEARISEDNGASWGLWTDITVAADGKVILAHDGADLIQVRVNAIPGTTFAGENAQQYSKQPISDLNIGEKVVDNSWEWEHRTGPAGWDNGGDPYSGTGVTKSVPWIIVARDHYGVGSGISLMSQELIGKFVFNGSDCYSKDYGISDLRAWLNGTGTYAGTGFYNAFSTKFKNAVKATTIPNKKWDYNTHVITSFTTADHVFVPSSSEMGYDGGIPFGTIFSYFVGPTIPTKKAWLGEESIYYWTRTPYEHQYYTMVAGGAGEDWTVYIFTYLARYGVRPVLNFSPNVLVSGAPNASGVYEIFYE